MLNPQPIQFFLHTYIVKSSPVCRKYESDFRRVFELACSVIRPMNDQVRVKIQSIVTQVV